MAAEVNEQQEPVRGFIVDTHLLRELGDLLVGRDSTAILELVKNGYDADATEVRIEAQNLNDPAKAVLVVSDNGTGMTVERFQSAFMRIAGRAKESGDRKSHVFERAYTGQKGIGRLASQKLANELEVVSVPAPITGSRPTSGVRARLDWKAIDEQDRLDQLKRGLDIDALIDNSTRTPGTTLTMRRLKRQWTADEITLFVDELRTAQPPGAIVDIADSLLAGPPLFTAPRIRTSKKDDPGFTMKFGGDLTPGDDLWQQANERFDWCIEVNVEGGRVHYQVTPTMRYVAEAPIARRYNFEATAPKGLSFQARFFFMPNASSRGPLGGFTRAQSGIRVYLEGFRVLPYGEFSDDWLGTDADYRSGPRLFTIDLDDENSDEVTTDADEGLNATSSAAFYGAVFLTTAGAPNLESLINREGFVPSATLQAIRDITRDALRLSVRVRRSITLQANALRDAAPTHDSEDPAPASGQDPAPRVDTRPVGSDRVSYGLMANRGPSEATRRTIDQASEAISRLSGSGLDQADKGTDLVSLADGFQAAREALSSVQAVQPELRTLAGVGLQLGAFVHDINGMLASVTTIRELLASVINDTTDRKHRSRLQIILGSADELAHVLTRQSSYLTDVLSADPRRRRSRIVVRDRVDSVLRFLAGRALERHLAVHVNVDDGLKTPPMFPSEVMILLTNLLTNAVKNAETTIWIDASVDVGGNTVIVISNDGVRVDLSESERWFLPFESTTTNVDEVLGQGLGLGLPIVRAIADDYGGDVRFVPPAHGSTAVQVWLKRKDF